MCKKVVYPQFKLYIIKIIALSLHHSGGNLVFICIQTTQQKKNKKKLREILSVKKKALPLHRFRSQGANIDAEVAQLVEHNLAKVRVASSSLVFRSLFLTCFWLFAVWFYVLFFIEFPFVSSKYHAEVAQLVEHNLAKVRVASSSLVFRSFWFLY